MQMLCARTGLTTAAMIAAVSLTGCGGGTKAAPATGSGASASSSAAGPAAQPLPALGSKTTMAKVESELADSTKRGETTHVVSETRTGETATGHTEGDLDYRTSPASMSLQIDKGGNKTRVILVPEAVYTQEAGRTRWSKTTKGDADYQKISDLLAAATSASTYDGNPILGHIPLTVTAVKPSGAHTLVTYHASVTGMDAAEVIAWSSKLIGRPLTSGQKESLAKNANPKIVVDYVFDERKLLQHLTMVISAKGMQTQTTDRRHTSWGEPLEIKGPATADAPDPMATGSAAGTTATP